MGKREDADDADDGENLQKAEKTEKTKNKSKLNAASKYDFEVDLADRKAEAAIQERKKQKEMATEVVSVEQEAVDAKTLANRKKKDKKKTEMVASGHVDFQA